MKPGPSRRKVSATAAAVTSMAGLRLLLGGGRRLGRHQLGGRRNWLRPRHSRLAGLLDDERSGAAGFWNDHLKLALVHHRKLPPWSSGDGIVAAVCGRKPKTFRRTVRG